MSLDLVVSCICETTSTTLSCTPRRPRQHLGSVETSCRNEPCLEIGQAVASGLRKRVWPESNSTGLVVHHRRLPKRSERND